MLIADLLPGNMRTAVTLSGERTVSEAVEAMAANKTDALIVTADEQPTGIFTRGDLMRAHMISGGGSLSAVPLRAAMTNKLITAAPGDPVADAINVMLHARIGHLPVSESGRITAVLSLRDLVSEFIATLLGELEHLNDYIARVQDSIQD